MTVVIGEREMLTPPWIWPDPQKVGELARQLRNGNPAGLVNQAVVKNSPGLLYGLTVYSSNVADQYLHVFDATSLPANGTAPTLPPFKLKSDTNFGAQWTPPRGFLHGIVICNSTTAATLTLGVADTFIDAQYL